MQNDLLLIQNTSADSTEYEEKFVNLTANKVVFVDINNLPTTTIKVSPNPTNAWLNINSPTPITQYALYDLTGRKVLTANNLNTQQTRIDLSTLPNGLYVLQLTDVNQQTSQQKVVLEK